MRKMLPYLMPESRTFGFRGECMSDRVSEKPVCLRQVIMASLVNIASLVLLRAFLMVPSLMSSFTAFSLFRASIWYSGNMSISEHPQTNRNHPQYVVPEYVRTVFSRQSTGPSKQETARINDCADKEVRESQRAKVRGHKGEATVTVMG